MFKSSFKSLTWREKAEIVKAVEENPTIKKKDIASKYGIPASTLSTILRSKDDILQRSSSSTCNPNSKRMRSCAFPEVEAALLKWFQQYRTRSNAVPISGALLLEKAQDFATHLDIVNFKASSSWLEKFKRRHNIVFRTLHGEANQVSSEICAEWCSKTLPSILSGYQESDVFNLDETALFYRCLPNKTMVFKGESCSGMKKSKERLTILVGANANGTEKLALLAIGKFKNPRCFKHVKSLPLEYTANKNAWMTMEIFESYVRKLDSLFCRSNRKVLLIVDNCPAHPRISGLKAVELQFLPKHTTAKLQPADAGIIHSLKHHYRKRLVRETIARLESGEESVQFHVLDALRMISSAWNIDVTQSTISNCFKKCVFFSDGAVVKELPDDDENPLWNQLSCDTTFEDFVNVDAQLETCQELSDTEIIAEVCGDVEDSDEEHPINVNSVPTASEAHSAFLCLQQFIESRKHVPNNVFQCLQTVEDFVSKQSFDSKKQTEITQYFDKICA